MDSLKLRTLRREIESLMRKAESGDEWAEICRLEEQMVALEAAERERADNSQFGVGA